MNRYLAPLVFCLALTTTQSFAKEPQAPPSPLEDAVPQSVPAEKGSNGSSIFFGHYGESITFPSGWSAEAELRGDVEAVYFHINSLEDSGYNSKPFQPKKTDYKLENFTPMGLIELVVIPKSTPGGLSSLAKMRQAKELELKQQNGDYEFFDSEDDQAWPRTTFMVTTLKPHRLLQVYSESAAEFYILTMGADLAPGEYGLDNNIASNFASTRISIKNSLRDYLRLTHKQSTVGYLFNFQDTSPDLMLTDIKETFDMVKASPGSMMLMAAGVMMLILALWPGKTARIRRLRMSGRIMIIFTLLSGFAGFLFTFLPAYFIGAVWNSEALADFIPVLFLAWISGAAARRLGSSHPKRVTAAAWILAGIWVMLIPRDVKHLRSGGDMIVLIPLLLAFIGLTFGIVFALAFGPVPSKEAAK